jgi:catechol 2,3-dioxygenase-like lactoylglutathione lyase family enzyme
MKTGHIGINVSDIARSKAFYTQAFGLSVMGESQQTGKQFAFLGEGGVLYVTLWQQSRGRFDSQTPGLHHLSFEVESIEEVQSAQARVRALGAEFLYDGVVPHSEGAQSGGIFFRDPDGIRLEIYAPSGAEQAEAPSGMAPSCGFF